MSRPRTPSKDYISRNYLSYLLRLWREDGEGPTNLAGVA